MPENDSIEYRPIPGFPGYRAGADGSIWSIRPRRRCAPISTRWRQLKTARVTGGYRQITLCDGTDKKSCLVHVAVLLAFVGPPLPGQECRHLDGSRTNNRLDNLAWGTRIENHQDKIDHGRSRPGSQNHNAKVTEAQVRLIRELAKQGHSGVSLARRFNLTPTTMSKIIRRKMWRHVA